MKLKKSLALVLGATLMIGVFAGCGSEQAPKKDTIKFAAETTYPPLSPLVLDPVSPTMSPDTIFFVTSALET